jgi:hypothetical protein
MARLLTATVPYFVKLNIFRCVRLRVNESERFFCLEFFSMLLVPLPYPLQMRFKMFLKRFVTCLTRGAAPFRRLSAVSVHEIPQKRNNLEIV